MIHLYFIFFKIDKNLKFMALFMTTILFVCFVFFLQINVSLSTKLFMANLTMLYRQMSRSLKSILQYCYVVYFDFLEVFKRLTTKQ